MERHMIVDRLVTHLMDTSEVLACWEGGSKAFGADDALSDIDLQVLVADGAVEKTRDGIERLLAAQPGIASRYEPPQPTWHGHWQAFYLFNDTSPFHMLDLLIIRESAPDRFLQRERHGEAHVLFDRGGFCRPVSFARDEHLARLRQKRELHIAAFRVFHWLVDKEIQRGRAIDALHFYQSLLTRVVELARMHHCPDRYDFGGRYLRRDLPPPVYEKLEALYFVRDLNDLSEKKEELVALFESLAGA